LWPRLDAEPPIVAIAWPDPVVSSWYVEAVAKKLLLVIDAERAAIALAAALVSGVEELADVELVSVPLVAVVGGGATGDVGIVKTPAV